MDADNAKRIGRHDRRLYRVMQCLSLLSKPDRPTTPEYLAERLGVSCRTVFRDLAAMREAGVPLGYSAQTRAYRLATRPDPPPSATWPLDRQESIALLAALRLKRFPPGSPVRDLLRTALPKILSTAGASLNTSANELIADARAVRRNGRTGLLRAKADSNSA